MSENFFVGFFTRWTLKLFVYPLFLVILRFAEALAAGILENFFDLKRERYLNWNSSRGQNGSEKLGDIICHDFFRVFSSRCLYLKGIFWNSCILYFFPILGWNFFRPVIQRGMYGNTWLSSSLFIETKWVWWFFSFSFSWGKSWLEILLHFQ